MKIVRLKQEKKLRTSVNFLKSNRLPVSTIVWPSITVLWPLVGGSDLASDWVRFSKSNRLSDNVSPKRGGIQPLSFLYIGNSYTWPSITLLLPLVGGSLASDWVRFSKSRKLHMHMLGVFIKLLYT